MDVRAVSSERGGSTSFYQAGYVLSLTSHRPPRSSSPIIPRYTSSLTPTSRSGAWEVWRESDGRGMQRDLMISSLLTGERGVPGVSETDRV